MLEEFTKDAFIVGKLVDARVESIGRRGAVNFNFHIGSRLERLQHRLHQHAGDREHL